MLKSHIFVSPTLSVPAPAPVSRTISEAAVVVKTNQSSSYAVRYALTVSLSAPAVDAVLFGSVSPVVALGKDTSAVLSISSQALYIYPSTIGEFV